MSDRPGRAFDRQGLGRHSYEQPTGPREHEKDTFVHTLVNWVNEAKKNNTFDNLIVIAPPHRFASEKPKRS